MKKVKNGKGSRARVYEAGATETAVAAVSDGGAVADGQRRGGGELARLLEEKKARSKAVDALLEVVDKASRTYYDGVQKCMMTEPDWKARASAAFDLLCFSDGRPVERKEVVEMHMDTIEMLERKVRQSPALKEALGRLLEQQTNHGRLTAVLC